MAGQAYGSCAGLPKVAESAGARVIYYWYVPERHIYLIYAYAKSQRENLNRQQIKILAELLKDMKDG